MNLENLAAATVEDFSDRRVFLHLDDSGVLDTCYGGLYHGQSPNGPTKAYITRSASDAALATFADGRGLALDTLRAFRDQGQVGARMLAAQAETLLA